MTSKPLPLDDLPFVRAISDDDWMAKGKPPDWYYRRGYDALVAIVQQCDLANVKPERILDFGCGHGAVARMLRAHFSKADIFGQDVNPDWLLWCKEYLGIEVIQSPPLISDVRLGDEKYDLIWAGSVFSHLPESPALHLLKEMRGALTERGIVVFSTAGQVMRNGYAPGKIAFISDEQIEEMATLFDQGHYAFHEYQGGVYKNWGHSLIPTRWMVQAAEKLEMPLSGYLQGGWGYTQDIYALRKGVTNRRWPA